MWFFISQVNRASMEWLRCLPSPVTLCSGQPKKPLVNPFIFFTLFSAGVFEVLNTCSQKLSKHFERKFYADLGLDLFQGFLVYSLICGSLLFRKFPPWFIVFPAEPRLWTLTPQSIKITILCLSSSPLLWKKWMVLSEKQLYTCGTHSISLLSRNGFFQFLSTFGCSPISPNTFKKCVFIVISRIQYSLI